MAYFLRAADAAKCNCNSPGYRNYYHPLGSTLLTPPVVTDKS